MRLLDPPAPVATAPNRNLAFAAALFEELARSRRPTRLRVSRLALGAARDRARARRRTCAPGPTWTNARPRSSRSVSPRLRARPCALVCTSGTAAANFLPAVVEAHLRPRSAAACSPRIVRRSSATGAPRRRSTRYASTALTSAGSPRRPSPSRPTPMLRHARALACRAVADATGATPGPVHLNLPFREPLDLRVVGGDAVRAAPLAGPRAARRRPTAIEPPDRDRAAPRTWRPRRARARAASAA